MSKTDTKLSKRRLRSSYLTTIVSISLVLFMLGLMGLLILNAKKLSNHVKENVGFSVILKNDVKEVDMIRLQKNLDASDFVKSTEFITKEKAAQNLQKDLGEDFIGFLGYNPLLSSIDIKLNANYANNDSLSIIEKKLRIYPQVKEVFYQKNLINLINENINRISLIIMLFSILLLFISVALINNTIRLTIYSKRFLINTMQLVGATRCFIRGPFLGRSIVHGIVSAIIAMSILSALIYFVQQELSGLMLFQQVDIIAILFFSVMLLGIIIAMVSTFIAVNKYLRIKTDDLYY
ncbi:MAG: permease-like cell division protein FtsX [Bacteroidales bacterium]|nr:permease-like cell division protein FtsX [Bacteroidales bacterium]